MPVVRVIENKIQALSNLAANQTSLGSPRAISISVASAMPTRMIDAGVSGHHDDVTTVPAQFIHLLAGHWQKWRGA